MSFLRDSSNLGAWARMLAEPMPASNAPWPKTIGDVIDMHTYKPVGEWIDVTKQADNGVALNPTVEAGVVNALQQECGETSEAHGFKNDWKQAEWLDALAEYLSKEGRFTTDITQPFGVSTVDGLKLAATSLRNNIIGTKIALIHSELSEGLESLRENGGVEGALAGDGNLGEELADAMVRILDTGTFIRAALGDELLRKMAINKDRPMMHGDKVM